jgi:hypothetical protein
MTIRTNTGPNIDKLIRSFSVNRGLVFGTLIITALLAFEVFNYSTTDFAMSDLLGDLSFAGIRWATILAIAFCGIDFAGIARLFTPEQGADEPAEVWYLFGAWLLAATMNATLTWWGVSIAILSHQSLGNPVINREDLLKIVPVFVAIMVWLIRVLIIGTFSVAGERLFTQASTRSSTSTRTVHQNARPTSTARPRSSASTPAYSQSFRPTTSQSSRPEPTYHPVSAKPSQNGNTTQRPMFRQ